MTAVAPSPVKSSPTVLHCDVAIVGGGIVGHTLALALKDSGLSIILLEATAESIAVAKRRAYVFSLLSGQIFDRLGLWQKVLPQVSQFSQIQISDADSPAIAKLYPQDLGQPCLGYGVTHHTMISALQAQLQGQAQFTTLCPARVDAWVPQGPGAELQVQIPEGQALVKARLVVGADGAQSPLRTAAQIDTKGWAYWQSCVTATIVPTIPHNNVAYERFWYDGPIGVLPLADGRVQIVWTAPHQKAQELLAKPEAEFLTHLEQVTGGLLGSLQLDSPRYLFPVRLMQSDRYVAERLALVGDAAHCCHPVAGQGMNLGIRDAAALAQVLTQAAQAGEDIGSPTVLQRYQRWRKPENWVVLAITDLLDRLFSNRWWPLVVVRRWGLAVLERWPWLRHWSLRVMTGLAGRSHQLGCDSLTVGAVAKD